MYSPARPPMKGLLTKLGEPPSRTITSVASRRSPRYFPATSNHKTRLVPSARFLSTTSCRRSAFSAQPEVAEVIPEISSEDTYDIVIIGGANAGLALACALLDKPSIRASKRILLIEGGSLARTRGWKGEGPWENRVSSLTSENIAWLDSIGVWKNIVEERSCPVLEMVIWANPTPDSTPNIHFPPLGHPMARMTENMNLQHALLKTIESAPQKTISIAEESRVTRMQLGPGGRWVGLQIGDKWVRGGVVVGADGPNSPVRKFSGIESFGHGYETHAIVATLEHDAPLVYTNNTAFQRFLPTGPLAFLPLSPTASTMVWSTLPSHAAAYKRLTPEALTMVVNAGYTLQEAPLAALNERILEADAAGKPLLTEEITAVLQLLPLEEHRSEMILPSTVKSIPAKSIASFPLRLSHAEVYLGERTVLVGDAAHTVHPLAGQGLNMGLADVRVLADTWEEASRSGADLGSKTTLAPYPRIRYPGNHLMLSTTDHLHHIFRNRSTPLNWLRGVGLDVINELGPLKKALMEGAGASVAGTRISEEDRQLGRTHGKPGGWPMAAASGLEGWLNFKKGAGMLAGMAGDMAKNGIKRAAEVVDRRQHP